MLHLHCRKTWFALRSPQPLAIANSRYLAPKQLPNVKESRTGSIESPKHQDAQPYLVGFSALWGLKALPIQVPAEEPTGSAGIPVSH